MMSFLVSEMPLAVTRWSSRPLRADDHFGMLAHPFSPRGHHFLFFGLPYRWIGFRPIRHHRSGDEIEDEKLCILDSVMAFPFARFWRLVSTVRGCRLFFRERLQAGRPAASDAIDRPLILLHW